MSAADAAYVLWVDHVHQLGGVATAWPFSVGQYGANYGQPAARFPADTFAALAEQGTLPMVMGVQFNVPGTWVYVLASAMTGTGEVDASAQAMTNATQAEAEQACAVNGNCTTSFDGIVKQVLIGLALVAGIEVASKLPKLG